jgi:hypothetical protein
MKIWISKGSEVPVQERLTAQIMLAVASGGLRPGQRLPSTRELARRFDIHSKLLLVFFGFALIAYVAVRIFESRTAVAR